MSDTYEPEETFQGAPIVLQPGSDEWLLLDSIRAARLPLEHGRQEAARDALARIVELIRFALPENFGAPWDHQHPVLSRTEMIEIVRFVRDAGMAAPAMSQLLIALEELDRGMVADFLLPASARGGKTPTDKMEWKALAVQAAEQLKAMHPKRAAYDAALEAEGTNRRTIETYEKQVAAAPADFKSPLNFFLRFWDKSPDQVLRLATVALAQSKDACGE